MKNYEDMTEKELLIEILKSEKKNARGQRVTAITLILMVAVLVIATFVVAPKVLEAAKGLKTAVGKADTLITDASKSLKELDVAIKNIDSMVGNVNDLVVTNTDNLNEAIEKINNIDFDNLNKAIKDLSDTVEPLANFFNKFKSD